MAERIVDSDGNILVVNTDGSINTTASTTAPATVPNTLLASAARTTTQTGADIINGSYRGVRVILDTTAVGTGSVTLSIQGKDNLGVYYTLLAGAAVTTVSTNIYTVYPGLAATANVSTSNVLPKTWRIVVTANNANTQTYSVTYDLIP